MTSTTASSSITTTTATTTSAPSSTESCLDIKPGKDGYLPPEACDALQDFPLSFGAAVLFTVLFGLTMVAHVFQAYAFKKRFCWVIIMASLWEFLGMIFRVLLTKHQNNEGFYTANFLLMLLSPLWINAFLYMILGRMIHLFTPTKTLARVSATRLALLFVILDIIAFLIQAAGAILASSQDAPASLTQNGLHIYMIGIGVQEAFILCFAALVVLLHRDLLRRERGDWVFEDDDAVGLGLRGKRWWSMGWRWLVYAIYVDLVLITTRIIYRLCEYSSGTTDSNKLLTSEAYPYVLDALPMFLALVVLNIFHPGRVLQGPDSEFPRLSRAEKKRIKREKKEMKAARKAERRAARSGRGIYDHQRLESLDSRESLEMV